MSKASKQKEEEQMRLPSHLEAFKKAIEKIEKVEKTDFKTFLQLLKAR